MRTYGHGSEQQIPSYSMFAANSNLQSSTLIHKTDNNANTKKRKVGHNRLNKFVRRLHDMLQAEQGCGVVEWRKGLLVLHSTDAFANEVLPKYFNTKNFKTFRRQLNYYGFVHVRSFPKTGSSTTALWVNQDIAKRGSCSISSVLMLKRIEPCDTAKTAEGRRVRKEEAASTIEDIGISTRSVEMEQTHQIACKVTESINDDEISNPNRNTTQASIPSVVKYTTDTQSIISDSTDSTPSLSGQIHDNGTRFSAKSEYPTTDDAAYLLIMFSKSSSDQL